MSAMTSRRAILAGVAAAPALVSLPALAADSETTFPDLAQKFESVYRRWLEQTTIEMRFGESFDAFFEKATGMSKAEFSSGFSFEMSEEDRQTKHNLFNRVWDEHKRSCGGQPDETFEEIWTAINDDLQEIVGEILEHPTRTLGDLKLQLRAFAVIENGLWRGGDNPEFIAQPRRIIDLVAQFLGVELLPGADHIIGPSA